jgi:NADH dehydrogenase
MNNVKNALSATLETAARTDFPPRHIEMATQPDTHDYEKAPIAEEPSKRTKVLILGGGFGGIYAALEFEKLLRRREDIEVTLVSRENFFVFTPMLHEIAASDLEVNAIVNPLRKILRRVDSFVGTVERIELANRRVSVSHGFDHHSHDLDYDHLILALGCGTNFFGLPGIETFALTFRSLGDAIELRNRLISLIEDASSECAVGERQPLLTVVVAGGGFAGVETLGAINDFVHQAIRCYPNLRSEKVRMVLVTPDELILPELGPKLGAYAQRKLISRRIEIITDARVKAATEDGIELTNGMKIPSRTLIWTAGTAAHPLLTALPVPNDRGRIKVDEFLQVPELAGLWAVGDCALVPDPLTGGFHPPTAQHAIREGRAAACNIIAEIDGRRKRPLRFSALGQLVAIGRRTGVANIFGINFSGFFAWWLWRTVYLSKLPRFEKKVRVALDWTLDLWFAKDFACIRVESAIAASHATVNASGGPTNSVAVEARTIRAAASGG